MTKIQIPYGSQPIELDIDAGVVGLKEGSVSGITTRDDVHVIRQALREPSGTKTLRDIVKKKKEPTIVIVVDDHTRATPTGRMLDALVDEIGKDYSNNIMVLVACGTHERPSEEDLKRIMGKHYGHYSIKIHECDAPDLVYLGTTSRGTPVKLNKSYVDADIKILTGDITLHYYAGFGGGRKSILPGIASRETIKKNHALLIDEHARTANLADNPVHLDMTEAASFALPDFVVNIITEGKGTVTDAYAGTMTHVFQQGVKRANDLFRVTVEELFDILIVSAGGFPADRNLFQASKAIENCYRAVKPGGDLILVAECRDGFGDPLFEQWMNKYGSFSEAEEAIRRDFVLGGHKAYYLRKVMTLVNLSTVSNLDKDVLKRWKIKAFTSLPDALAAVKKDKGKVGIVTRGFDALLQPAIK